MLFRSYRGIMNFNYEQKTLTLDSFEWKEFLQFSNNAKLTIEPFAKNKFPKTLNKQNVGVNFLQNFFRCCQLARIGQKKSYFYKLSYFVGK